MNNEEARREIDEMMMITCIDAINREFEKNNKEINSLNRLFDYCDGEKEIDKFLDEALNG